MIKYRGVVVDHMQLIEKLEFDYDGRRLNGGVIQYELIDYPTSGGPITDNDQRWTPLGSIANMADDPSTLVSRWNSISAYDDRTDLSDSSTGCGGATAEWDPY